MDKQKYWEQILAKEDLDDDLYQQSMKFATDPNANMLIIYSNELDLNFRFVIVPTADTDFWMDVYPSLGEAISVCEDMGWNYSLDDSIPVPSPTPKAQQIDGNHYVKFDIQPWDAIKCWLGMDGYRSFLRGNVVKYICRAGNKGDERIDLEKARHYLNELITTYG
jgi:hypothetical protein